MDIAEKTRLAIEAAKAADAAKRPEIEKKRDDARAAWLSQVVGHVSNTMIAHRRNVVVVSGPWPRWGWLDDQPGSPAGSNDMRLTGDRWRHHDGREHVEPALREAGFTVTSRSDMGAGCGIRNYLVVGLTADDVDGVDWFNDVVFLSLQSRPPPA